MRLFLCIFMIVSPGIPGVRAQGADSLPLVRVDELCGIPSGQVSQTGPIRVRGVVTAVTSAGDDPREKAVFTIHDGSAGIFVVVGDRLEGVEWKGGSEVLDAIEVGSDVEIEGVLEQGALKPNIVATDMKVLGWAELSAPKSVSMESLLSGAEATEWVETEGVVQSCVPFNKDTWLLRIDTHAGYFMARIHRFLMDARPLVDARVRVRGVVQSAYNGRSEFVRPNIWLNRSEDLVVVDPAPPDPFLVPKVALASLDGFTIQGRSLRRRRVEGTVTYCEADNFLYLQQGTRAIKVGLASQEAANPGDWIEASGFLDISGAVAGLRGAVVRKLESGEAIEPLPTSFDEIRRSFEPVIRGLPSSPHDFDGLLVQVTGRLMSVQRLTGRGKARLLLDRADQLMTADLDPVTLDSLGGLQVGSLVRVVGVAVVEYAASRQVQELSQPVGLNLLLRGAGDVVVMDAASWWTPRRLGMAAIMLGVILIAVLGWSFTLQRLLRKRTGRLEEVMQVHRDQELEFRGARHERQRLAADMHDGVQQLIAGAAFRLEAAATHLTEMPAIVNTQFTAARDALLRAQEGLRDCLAGMLYVDEGPTEFPALLRYAAAAMDHWSEDLVDVRVAGGEPYPLTRHVKGNLLLLMQEAVGNAVKHGRARHVLITLTYGKEEFEMTLEDDGSGIDPQQDWDRKSGHFGLESMRHRMSWLGGTVEILTAAAGGVRVRARMPRPPLPTKESLNDPEPIGVGGGR